MPGPPAPAAGGTRLREGSETAAAGEEEEGVVGMTLKAWFYADDDDDTTLHGPVSLNVMKEWLDDGHFEATDLIRHGRNGASVTLEGVLASNVGEFSKVPCLPSRSRVPPAVVAAARVGPSPLPPTAPFAVTLSVQEIAADRRSHLGKVIVEWTDGCSGQDPILKWTIIAKNMADGSEVNVEVLAPTTQAEVDALYIFLNPLHARLGTVVSGLTPGATYTFAVRTTSARHLVGEMSTASKSLTLSGTASVTPGQVIDVVATKVEFKRGQLELTWRAPPAPCGDPATEFTITSTPPLSGGSANVVVTNTTRTMLHDLATDGTAYTFTIVSRTAKGIESVVSNPSGAVATWSDDDEVARNDGSDGWAAANHRQVPLKKHSRGFTRYGHTCCWCTDKFSTYISSSYCCSPTSPTHYVIKQNSGSTYSYNGTGSQTSWSSYTKHAGFGIPPVRAAEDSACADSDEHAAEQEEQRLHGAPPSALATAGGDSAANGKRIADDGLAYTKEEFIGHYGGEDEWFAAEPHKSSSDE